GLVHFQGIVTANSGLVDGSGSSIRFDHDVTISPGDTDTNLSGNVALGNSITIDTTGANITIGSLDGNGDDLNLAAGIGTGTITITGPATNLGDGIGPALTIQNGVTGLVSLSGGVTGNSGIVAEASDSNILLGGVVTLADGD